MTNWTDLQNRLGDNLRLDHLHRVLYATDASVYREMPVGVAYPRQEEDLEAILYFARQEGIPLIPRTAGTSLAGQVVGSGLVIDFSRHMHRILSLDQEARTVVVQPGVIRDQLNDSLRPHGLLFGPNTATANRCMIGGMVGNNSCGSTSIVYGTTRDRLLALDTLLSDGSRVRFEALDSRAFAQKLQAPGLEGRVYRHIHDLLSDPEVAREIRSRYPKPEIHRRNTGYALDRLLADQPFQQDGPAFNWCHLLAGSEGTLALTHRITLQLDPLPPPHVALVCAHFHSLREMTESVLIAMEHHLFACELMDRTVLECTRSSRAQQANRFFVEGDPAAVLICECRGASEQEARHLADQVADDLRHRGSPYATPVVTGPQADRVWSLRAAGLGVLANLPGDAKAVACIEDTAVALADLPDYIDDLDRLIRGFGQTAAYFAHAGAGELHVRPILDLKTIRGQQLFQEITTAVAALVKQYKGSFSGEHGDGRLRGSFLPILYGDRIAGWFDDLKTTWDPDFILNPGKIVHVPPMLQDMRYAGGQQTHTFPTAMDFSDSGGILRMAERCNGAGDCRRLPGHGNTMCPSYQATREEKDTTRARANALREFLTRSDLSSPFLEPALDDVMDLCLSCKGCTRECPSSVDIAALKAEWQHQVHQVKGIPLRHRLIGQIATVNRWLSIAPGWYNTLVRTAPVKKILQWTMGIHPDRTLPRLNNQRFSTWMTRYGRGIPVRQPVQRQVWIFVDEFTEHYDLTVGQAAIRLLHGLGYAARLARHGDSGRAAISKGMLDHAGQLARQNIAMLDSQLREDDVLIGLEPSALLTLRDEYLRLAGPDHQEAAKRLAARALLLEEFLYREAEAGRITPADFSDRKRQILLHGHCHQKALSEQGQAAFLLALPVGHSVDIIPSGCCGMAGSFGYEEEHYALSQQIGELVLFPAVRQASETTVIAASGHSCRHQITDGTRRTARHVVEILEEALLENANNQIPNSK
ncbi:MAG: FAD-binding protein [Lewinellaceae bacterium]|nr:FAD-binding protein [Lewinellaceae bacterium]